MRVDKQKRAEREAEWQYQNNNPLALCEGTFYIWNRSTVEDCPCRKTCTRHISYTDAVNQGLPIYELPRVQFYYVAAFRKCPFKTA